MRLFTTRTRILAVADRWQAQYYKRRNGEWVDADKKATWERLVALDKLKATTEDVVAIVGNGSWTRTACDECGADVDAVVQLGQEPDYESSTAMVCEACLRSALDRILYADGRK